MPVYPAARTQGTMQAALNSLRESSQDQELRFRYFNSENALDLAKQQAAMNATHTLRADKAAWESAKDRSDGGGTGGWGAIGGTVIGAAVGGPAGATLGASLGGAVDQATSRGGGRGGAATINTGIGNALDIYTEMNKFDVPAVQEYMDDFYAGFPALENYYRN